jgi:hypothetical protein
MLAGGRRTTILWVIAAAAIGCGEIVANVDHDASPCDDADGDGVCDADDACPGADDSLDADDDGVPDGCDVCAGDDEQDADDDGVPDACDVCLSGDDTVDADSDTVPDDCDVCPGFDDRIDTDGDEVPDGCEVPEVEDLLIVHGNASGEFLDCVVAGLTPFYSSVTAVAGVPTPDQLAAADAVLVYNNGGHDDAAGLGNALADFFDAKGHVVEALYGTGALSGMAGRWATGAYAVLAGAYDSNAVTLGTVSEPGSPLMADVAALGASRTVNGTAVNGGIVVASWSSGTPVVVRAVRGDFNRVDLGMFPGGCSGGYWTGDGFALMRNALDY